MPKKSQKWEGQRAMWNGNGRVVEADSQTEKGGREAANLNMPGANSFHPVRVRQEEG